MAQQIYTSIGGRQKNKRKRLFIILVCIAAAIVLGLAAVGFIVGSDGEAHLGVSQAIAENVQLKQQIDTLNSEIERLNAEVERLGGELAARPTSAPETTASPLPSASPEAVSPRGYY